jgi:hypothetical protein
MHKRSTAFLAPMIAAAMAVGLAVQMGAYRQGDTEATTAFHVRVKAAVEAIPMQVGGWAGKDTEVPAAAGQLLRPNALFTRTYTDPERGLWAKLVVIHCRDSRDMSGHYPPNCYSGSGWTQQGPAAVAHHELWGGSIPIAAYEFTRKEIRGELHWVIYDFFVLPAAGIVTEMADVQKASGDYRTRPYGAAQVQVIMDARMTEAERMSILREMLGPVGPVVRELQNMSGGMQP